MYLFERWKGKEEEGQEGSKSYYNLITPQAHVLRSLATASSLLGKNPLKLQNPGTLNPPTGPAHVYTQSIRKKIIIKNKICTMTNDERIVSKGLWDDVDFLFDDREGVLMPRLKRVELLPLQRKQLK